MKRALGAQGPGTAHHGGRELTVPRCCGRSRATRLAFPEAFLRQTLQGFQRQKSDKKVFLPKRNLRKRSMQQLLSVSFATPFFAPMKGETVRILKPARISSKNLGLTRFWFSGLPQGFLTEPDSRRMSFEFNGCVLRCTLKVLRKF